MNHLDFIPTPITYSPYLSSIMGSDIYFKREDLFVKGGGGNKARMLSYILAKAKNEKADYVLTAGGPYSNFNRALALMCKQAGLKVKLVLYDKNTHLNEKSLNKRISDFCDIEYVFCSPDKVIDTLEKEKKVFKKKGLRFFYVWGGGKSNEGVQAYYDCAMEIKKQIDFTPDLIITALGTGTTFCGISIGCAKYLPETKVLGISVARKKKNIFPVINEIINDYQKNNRIKPEVTLADLQKNVFDEFLMGGYGLTNKPYQDFIKKVICHEATLFDSIYVGKALYGLYIQMQKDKTIRDKRIIFLNTGGIFNF